MHYIVIHRCNCVQPILYFPSWWKERVDCTQQLVVSDDTCINPRKDLFVASWVSLVQTLMTLAFANLAK